MTRQEIIQQIAALDQQINAEVAKTRVPSLNMKYRSFPWGSWSSAVVFAALWLYNDAFLPPEFKWVQYVFLVLAALSALSGTWRTFMFLIKGRQKADKNYEANTERVRVLQDQRQGLQKQLKEIDKK